MNLNEALKRAKQGGGLITRPRLLAERSVYITYEAPDAPLRQHWIGRPGLSIDWTPALSDILADDWLIVSTAWAKLRVPAV